MEVQLQAKLEDNSTQSNGRSSIVSMALYSTMVLRCVHQLASKAACSLAMHQVRRVIKVIHHHLLTNISLTDGQASSRLT